MYCRRCKVEVVAAAPEGLTTGSALRAYNDMAHAASFDPRNISSSQKPQGLQSLIAIQMENRIKAIESLLASGLLTEEDVKQLMDKI